MVGRMWIWFMFITIVSARWLLDHPVWVTPCPACWFWTISWTRFQTLPRTCWTTWMTATGSLSCSTSVTSHSIIVNLYQVPVMWVNSWVSPQIATCFSAIAIILIIIVSDTTMCIACSALWSVYWVKEGNVLFGCTHLTVNDDDAGIYLRLGGLCAAEGRFQSAETLLTE